MLVLEICSVPTHLRSQDPMIYIIGDDKTQRGHPTKLVRCWLFFFFFFSFYFYPFISIVASSYVREYIYPKLYHVWWVTVLVVKLKQLCGTAEPFPGQRKCCV